MKKRKLASEKPKSRKKKVGKRIGKDKKGNDKPFEFMNPVGKNPFGGGWW